MFQAQGWLLERWGVARMLDVTALTYALRMLLYASLPSWGSPWAVLPVEVLHGITFGLGWGCGTENCKRLAPQELRATMQGVFQGRAGGGGQLRGAAWGRGHRCT